MCEDEHEKRRDKFHNMVLCYKFLYFIMTIASSLYMRDIIARFPLELPYKITSRSEWSNYKNKEMLNQILSQFDSA